MSLLACAGTNDCRSGEFLGPRDYTHVAVAVLVPLARPARTWRIARGVRPGRIARLGRLGLRRRSYRARRRTGTAESLACVFGRLLFDHELTAHQRARHAAPQVSEQ